MILNAEQERESNRAEKLVEYLLSQKKEYEARKPFNEVVQKLLSNVKRLDPLIPEKGTRGTYVTKGKAELKEDLAADVNEVCTNATVYAKSIGDKELQQAVRYRTSGITKAKDGDVLGIVTIITTAITPIISEPAFQPYDITADTLSNLTEKATAFNDSRGKAKVVDTNSSLANDDINAVFKDISGNIADLNLLITWFNKKNPKFVKGYRTSAAIDHSGIRHSGVKGIINSSNGALIDDASITLKGNRNTKFTTTNSGGAWEIIKFASGQAKLTVSAPGCETQVIPVTIIRGKITELNITLQSLVVSLTATA